MEDLKAAEIGDEAYEFNKLLDRLAEARGRAIEVLTDRLLARGVTATPPFHIWYDEKTDMVEVRPDLAPPDAARPKMLQGLDLNVFLKLAGTLRRDKATEKKLGYGPDKKIYYMQGSRAGKTQKGAL